MAFDTFNLHEDILKAVLESGYSEPTQIQRDAIPIILARKDIRASAKTGTGKTAAFLLPIFHRLATTPRIGKGPRVLILVPTRELGMQIAEQARKYSKYLEQIKTVSIGGGIPYDRQKKQLARPYDVLIATPGRLIDYLGQRKIQLSDVEVLVLDEADRMLDMGFIGPVNEIASETSTDRQTLLFSATLPRSVIKLSADLLTDPIEIKVHSDVEKHENIHQSFHFVGDIHHKNKILDHVLSKEDVNHAIVFTATKRHADQLACELQDRGHLADALHGDMSQRQRTKAITQLKTGKIKILVATDVAARGIDIQSITHVINFDLPRNVEDYVHRIGRTGRAGAKGTALSLVSGRDAPLVEKIKKFTGQPIEVIEIPGFERPKNTFGEKKQKKVYGERPHNRGRNNFRSRGSAMSKGSGKPPGKGGKKNNSQGQSWSRDNKSNNQSFKIIRNTNRGK